MSETRDDVGVVQDLGWGRLVFGQTFDDPAEFGTALRAEASGRRDIGMYSMPPRTSSWPCTRRSSSSTPPASPTGSISTTAANSGRVRCPGSWCAPRPIARRLRRDQRDLPTLPDGARRYRPDVEQRRARAAHGLSGGHRRTHRRTDRHRHRYRPSATVRGGRRERLKPVVPGGGPVGVATRRRGGLLVRSLVEEFIRRGRAQMDLSVLHDNEGAIALYERMGVPPGSHAGHQAQERHQRETLRPGAGGGGPRRVEPVRPHHRRRGHHAGDPRGGARR